MGTDNIKNNKKEKRKLDFPSYCFEKSQFSNYK
jgi:hypothetical protein